MKENDKFKCVSLVGGLADWGNHILMPYGITLCGMPTIDVNKDDFPSLKEKVLSDIISEYKIEEWNITCKMCLDIIVLAKTKKQ